MPSKFIAKSYVDNAIRAELGRQEALENIIKNVHHEFSSIIEPLAARIANLQDRDPSAALKELQEVVNGLQKWVYVVDERLAILTESGIRGMIAESKGGNWVKQCSIRSGKDLLNMIYCLTERSDTNFQKRCLSNICDQFREKARTRSF
jgi:hypothetical protein